MSIVLRPAQPADIPFVMTTERIPGHEHFIGQWSEIEHQNALSNEGNLYLLGAEGGKALQGFAILMHCTDLHGNLLLKRIAVCEAGQGFGFPFLTAVVNWVFKNTKTHRFWLDVLEDNLRAQHVYEKCGFRKEGLMRQCAQTLDGGRANMFLMSILRPEWTSTVETNFIN